MPSRKKPKAKPEKLQPVPGPASGSKKLGTRNSELGTPRWLSLRNQLIICVLLAVGLYANTLGNEYALDDGLVIAENPNTKRGLAGLSEIFTSDSYEHYYRQFDAEGELPGGRYRPLSVATFALEWELFAHPNAEAVEKGNPAISHAINVLLFALTVALLVILLNKYWFTKRPLLAFLSVLIFTIHPIHTEAIANIKSRDEILSLLFLVLTLLQVFRYARKREMPAVILAGFFYLLALLSKENGITFLAVIPLALFCFTKLKLKEITNVSLPLFAVGAAFVFIRYQVVGLGGEGATGVMNDPFFLAQPGERLPTILVTLFEYIKLLFWPHPLSFDYGYNHFGYASFGDPISAMSLLLHLGLFVAGIFGALKKRPWAFGILFYLITLSIISNIVFPIGASIGERLIYLSSVGFAIAMGVVLEWLVKRLGESVPLAVAVAIVTIPLTVLAAVKTIPRNADWRNNSTLFLADVSKVPNSIKANVSAATGLIEEADKPENATSKDSLLNQAIPYLQHAIDIQKDLPRNDHFPDVYLNLGAVYHRLGKYSDAADAYIIVFPENKWFQQNQLSVVQAFRLAGDEAYQRNDMVKAEAYLMRALVYEPNSADLMHRLGGVYYTKGDIASARSAYEKSSELAPDSPEVWYNLGGFYYTIKDYPKAVRAFERTLQLQPENAQAQQGLVAAREAMRG